MFSNPLPWSRKQGPLDFMRGYYLQLETWASDTQALSATEEGIYGRLLHWAMRNECDVPLELNECYRIARATTAGEKKVVSTVLARMFKKSENGFTCGKLSEEIDRWKGNKPAFEARKENLRARVDRWRKKQQAAARLAHAHGVSLDGNPSGFEMDERLAEAGVTVDNSDEVTRYVTRYGDVTEASRDASRNASGNAAAISVAVTEEKLSSESSAREGGGVAVGLGAAGAACREMRRVGLVGVNPSHPQLLALLAAGATLDHFAALAASAVARGKGFGWVLAAVQGQLTEGERSARALADRKHDEAGSVMAQLAPSLVKSR